MDCNVDTPTIGKFAAKAKPCATPIPMRTPVKLPDKDGGTTYVFNWTNAIYPGSERNSVHQIKIAPMINQRQCEPSYSITEIVNCEVFVF